MAKIQEINTKLKDMGGAFEKMLEEFTLEERADLRVIRSLSAFHDQVMGAIKKFEGQTALNSSKRRYEQALEQPTAQMTAPKAKK